MQSRLLQGFLTVAEHGSITEAANKLNVSQPSLTRAIKKLETDLGMPLFDRTPTGISLTRFGLILQHHAKIMENEYLHAIANMESLKSGNSGGLRIGAGPLWLVSILPPIVADFQFQYPEIKVSLKGGPPDTLVQGLIQGDFDIICMPLEFQNRSEIVKHPRMNVRHVLVADASHPLSLKDTLVPEDLQAYPWMVLGNDHFGSERLASFFATHGLPPPNIALETSSIHNLLQGLRSGDCLAHISEQMLPLARALGVERLDLDGTIWEFTAGYALRSGPPGYRPLRNFIDVLETYLSTAET